MSKKVFLLGGAGIPNFGDELIIDSWLRWYIDENSYEAENLVLSGANTRVMRMLFGGLYPNLRYDDLARKRRVQKGRLSFFESIEDGYQFVNDSENDGHPLISTIQQSDLLHLYGGGYLNSKWPTHGFLLGLVSAAAQRFGIEAVATGIGLGPFSYSQGDKTDAFGKALKSFKAFEVRDSESANICREIGDCEPILGLDDVFIQPVRTRRRSGSTLHLSLFNDGMGDLLMERLSPDIVESFDRHVFWSCLPGDAAAYARLTKLYPYFEFFDSKSLLEGVPTSDRDVMITQRFHPHLIGARVGMDGVYRSNSEYYDVKHQSVLDLGSSFTRSLLSELDSVAVNSRNQASFHADLDRVNEKRVRAGVFTF